MGANLTDVEWAALQGLPTLDAQQSSLQKQLDFARALRAATPQKRHATGLGALLGGAGQVLGGIGAATQERDLQGKLDALLQQRGAGESAGAKLKALMDQQRLKAGDQDLAAGAQRMGIEKTEADAKAAARSRLLDPASPRATMGAALLQKLGLTAPAGSNAEDIEAQIPGATRLEISKQASRDRALAREQSQFARGDAAAARLEAQKAKQLEALIQKASKDTEEWSGQQDALATLEKTLDTKEGVGRIEGRLADLGIGSAQALQNRQAMATLGNAILRARSGAAVTPNEAERVAIESGMAAGASEAQFEAGGRAIVAVLRRGAANVRAKYPQEAWDEIAARGGTVPPAGASTPVTDAASAGALTPAEAEELKALKARFGGGK